MSSVEDTPLTLRSATEELVQQEGDLRVGTGQAGIDRQRRLGRLTARERIDLLLDSGTELLELNLWAAYEMYQQWGQVPSAGVVTGVGTIAGCECMVVANDATVKAGSFFPQTVKKVLRAQRVAHRCRLPLVYLVDSAGVFLPLQDEIFPDEDDFGRIFRNNSVLSAAGNPQFAAIMGNCVAGGAYLPVLCDKILMTEGSALYLAGPSLVKAAIGQVVDEEELGGAKMHAEVSGTVDFHEPDDPACIARLRSLVAGLPAAPFGTPEATAYHSPALPADSLYQTACPAGRKEYDSRDLISALVDGPAPEQAGNGAADVSFDEYKPNYGKTLVTVYARLGGQPIGIVANQRTHSRTRQGEVQIGGVIYKESADKAARFIMDCNQTQTPLLFLQDVTGFMVGRAAEQSGITRSGAKLVNAISNSTVPRITVVVGGSYGAGNYALCGKAFDPHFIYAWPAARYAVMGGAQAAETLVALQRRQMERGGAQLSDEELKQLQQEIEAGYLRQTDIRYGAARGWVDAIVSPECTRDVLIRSFQLACRPELDGGMRTGVLQV